MTRQEITFLKAACDGDVNILEEISSDVERVDRITDPYGRNGLHIAASVGNLDTCDFLIMGLKFDIDSTDYKGITPLILALMNGKNPTARYLIEAGADIGYADFLGWNSLHYAVKGNNVEMAEFLLARGAFPNLLTTSHASPLMAAVSSNSIECVDLLLLAGAEVNFLSGTTPLICAASSGYNDVMGSLLAGGAEVDAVDVFGLSAIEHAAVAGQVITVARLLLISGLVDIQAANFIDDHFTDSAVEQRRVKTSEDVNLSKIKAELAFKEGDYEKACFWYAQAGLLVADVSVDEKLTISRLANHSCHSWDDADYNCFLRYAKRQGTFSAAKKVFDLAKFFFVDEKEVFVESAFLEERYGLLASAESDVKGCIGNMLELQPVVLRDFVLDWLNESAKARFQGMVHTSKSIVDELVFVLQKAAGDGAAGDGVDLREIWKLLSSGKEDDEDAEASQDGEGVERDATVVDLREIWKLLSSVKEDDENAEASQDGEDEERETVVKDVEDPVIEGPVIL